MFNFLKKLKSSLILELLNFLLETELSGVNSYTHELPYCFNICKIQPEQGMLGYGLLPMHMFFGMPVVEHSEKTEGIYP